MPDSAVFTCRVKNKHCTAAVALLVIVSSPQRLNEFHQCRLGFYQVALLLGFNFCGNVLKQVRLKTMVRYDCDDEA